MKKLLVLAALLGALAVLMPLAALASPGKSTDTRQDGWTYCYTNGHGYVVYKDDSATC